MKERPIIFSPAMVRAIVGGRKTQTRRVVRETIGCADKFQQSAVAGMFRCPYGGPGDRLWVRESWQQNVPGCPNGISYHADHVDPRGDGPAHPMKWRSPIFMPRSASRILLTIVDAGVHRLQEIDEDDAVAEGIDARPQRARPWFRTRWDEINGRRRGRSWADNPWVWAIKFARETKHE